MPWGPWFYFSWLHTYLVKGRGFTEAQMGTLAVGAKFAGAVTGAMNSGGQLGGFACAVVFGYVVKATGDYNMPLFAIGARCLPLLCHKSTPQPATERAAGKVGCDPAGNPDAEAGNRVRVMPLCANPVSPAAGCR